MISLLLNALLHALSLSLIMSWEILWPLILGFTISGIIQAVVSHRQITKLLPNAKPATLAKASLLGASSSSCSYAAVALSRSIFQKGGNFIASMAFEISSTNLVIELGIIMFLLLGWQFTLAEFIGGPIMIIIMSILMRRILTKKTIQTAFNQATNNLPGKMEGHAHMDDMSIKGSNSIIKKIISPSGRTAISHYFFMDIISIGPDIILGLLIAGALAAWIPPNFWRSFFFVSHPLLNTLWGPLIGPIIAMLSFVCSIGNIPLAVVLWHGGLSFGGVISFIFADLLIIPIIRIKIKYYGLKMTTLVVTIYYISMVIASYIIEGLFKIFSITPHLTKFLSSHYTFHWGYTSDLNLFFILLTVIMLRRFIKTGGPMMIKMMNSNSSNSPTTTGHCH